MSRSSVRPSRAIALGALVLGLVLALSMASTAFAAGPMPVYRFYKMKTGAHF